MDIILEMLVEAGKLFLFFLVAVALIISSILLFKPGMAFNLNERFNEFFSEKTLGKKINAYIEPTDWLLQYRIVVCCLYLVGSIFCMKFLWFDFNEQALLGLILKDPLSTNWEMLGIALTAFKWFMLFLSVLGVAMCLLLIVSPESFCKLNDMLNRDISMGWLRELMDTSYKNPDHWAFNNHVLVGLFLILGSGLLIIFYLYNVL